MKRLALAGWVAAFVWAGSACADDGAWDVDASGNWTDTANWLGTVVPAGVANSAFFTNDITQNITVTLDGATPVTLGATVFSNTAGRTWTFTGGSFSDLGTILVETTTTVVVESSLTGTAGLAKDGTGILMLSGNNTFDGLTIVSGGRLLVSNANALGSTAEGTIVSNYAAVRLAGNITVAEPFKIISSQGDPQWSGAIISQAGLTNTCAGPITNVSSRIGAESGSGLIIAGGVVGANSSMSIQAVGTVVFSNQPVNLGTGQLTSHSGGRTVMSVSSNVIGTLQVGYGNTFIFDAEDAFPTTFHLQVGAGLPGWKSTVDLNGHTVVVGRLSNSSSNAPGCVIQSATPATLIVNQSVNSAVTNQMIGPITLAKDGPGILTLDGPMAYTGKTIVSNGVLQIGPNGSISNSPIVETVGNGTLALPAGGYTFLSGQTVQGTGRISGGLLLDTGATLAPGLSTGTLTVSNDVSLLSGSFFSVEFDGISLGEYDRLLMVGSGDTLTLGGTLQVTDSMVFAPLLDVFPIVIGFETLSGTFQGLPEDALIVTANNTYRINYNADNVTLSVVVPEPSTIGLLSVAVLLLRRRRRS